MANDIKKIIDSLNEAQVNLDSSRNKLSAWLDDIGYQIELAETQKNLWTDLEKQTNVSAVVTTSGYNQAQSLVQNAKEINSYVDQQQIDQSIFSASSLIEAVAGTAISGATLSYPPNQLPPTYHQLDGIMSQHANQKNISQKLRLIEPSLADEYDNAWFTLHTTLKDETRSPMFLIREVINRLYHHYAPDDKVKAYHTLAKDDKITRKHRVDYLATLVDPWQRRTFLNEEQALLDIYRELSKAHKHGLLNLSETKGFLYQANGLIKLLLELL